MPSGYRYAGAILAQAGGLFDVQHKNLGMLELNIDSLVPGAKETLILSIEDFKVPGREMEIGDLHYLNGVVRYPKKISPLGTISATFRDFPEARTRAFLNEWFRLTYDEETGLSVPTSLLKATGWMVLFQSNATLERQARLDGIWLAKQPDVEIDHSDGEHMTMEVEISVDRVVWQNALPLTAAA